MLAKVKRLFTPSVGIEEEKLYLVSVLNVILVIVLIGLVVFTIMTLINGFSVGLLGSFAAGLITLISLGLVRRGQLLWPSIFVPSVHLLLVTAIVSQGGGIHSYGLIGYGVVLVLAAMLLGQRGLAIFTVLVVLAITGIMYAEINGILVNDLSDQTRWGNLVDILFVVFLLSAFLFALIGYLSASVSLARSNARTLAERNNELLAIQATLEEQVVSRTRGLQTVTELSELLNQILDFDQLLAELVDSVKTRFGYYHAHVYLLDETRENLVVAAGAGEAGRQMQAARHSIPFNALTSLVARSARNNEAVIVDNVQEQPDWLPNELLPETVSEMAVPIVVDDQVVGILDVQSTKLAGFDEGDASVLRSLANQVSVAIRNARLFARTEAARTEAEAAQARYVERAWTGGQNAQQRSHYHRQGAPEPSQDEIAHLLQLAQTKEQVDLVPADKPALVAPIKLQNQVIGAMQFVETDPDRRRAYTDQELAFVRAIADQVAQSAENLRLFDETRQRASREQLARQITDKIRSSRDIEAAMKTAVEELGRALNLSSAEVGLKLTAEGQRPAEDLKAQTNGSGNNQAS